MDELGPASLRLVVVAQPHPIDELGLAGQVGVVGARLSARGHERLAVEDVWPDRADHDPGRLRHVSQRGGIVDVGVQQRHLAVGAVEPRAHRLELLAVTARQREPCARGSVLRQVLGGQTAGKPGGAE